MNTSPDLCPTSAPALAGAEVGAARGLGNNADFATPPGLDVHETLAPPSTVKAWYLRSYGRELLSKSGIQKRMRWCGSRIRRDLDGVAVYARPDRAYGRVYGVCVCGQSLACPVCAPRIAAFRSAEVAEAFARATARGFEARLVTFTIPHDRSTSLGQEVDLFSAAWRAYQSGAKATRRETKSLGHHVGREVTYSAQNGFHYHHHQLRYDLPNAFQVERAKAQWLAALAAVGRLRKGADLHAFDAGIVGNCAGARYVAKLATSVDAQARAIGSEIASSSTKGRNLASLLVDSFKGDAQASAVWVSAVRDITSRKISSVRWSRGLRGELGLAGDKTDETVAAEESLPTDIFLGALNPMQWRGILRNRCEFALLVAANQGEDAVNKFLRGLDLGNLNDEMPRAVLRDQTRGVSKC